MNIPLQLSCPTCHAPSLTHAEVAEHFICITCKTSYPVIGGVPFLFPNPELELARWEARAHNELQNLREKKSQCDDALHKAQTDHGLSDLTIARLTHLATAYEQQMACLDQLLGASLLKTPGSDRTTYKALDTPLLTDSTTLFSYASNLFRDWVWGDEENNQALSMLTRVGRKPLGKTLVLGAGGGRLAWDLAAETDAEVVAVDINPFTTLAAAHITGTTANVSNITPESIPKSAPESASALNLWEFPLAPISTRDCAIERHLQAPETPKSPKLQFILADARALPFASERFDTVVTPWFTDVVQQAPTATAQQINSLLSPGGQWLNFGSVAFANADPAKTLLLDELCSLVEQEGFDSPETREERGPYLCSPHSRFGRTELLHAFAAEKLTDTQAIEQEVSEPEWLKDPSMAIPALPAFTEQAMATQVHAYLMSLIDGTRSISSIARVLEEQRLMSAREAVPVIQGFLAKMADESGQ